MENNAPIMTNIQESVVLHKQVLHERYTKRFIQLTSLPTELIEHICSKVVMKNICGITNVLTNYNTQFIGYDYSVFIAKEISGETDTDTPSADPTVAARDRS